jgi:hypothetical protein
MTGRLPDQALRPGTGSVKIPDRLLTQQVSEPFLFFQLLILPLLCSPHHFSACGLRVSVASPFTVPFDVLLCALLCYRTTRRVSPLQCQA